MTRGDVERLTGFRRVDVWSFALGALVVIIVATAWGSAGASTYTVAAPGADAGWPFGPMVAIVAAGSVVGPLMAIRLLEHRWPRPRIRRRQKQKQPYFGAVLLALFLGNMAATTAVQALWSAGAGSDASATSYGYLIATSDFHLTRVVTELSAAVWLVVVVSGFVVGWSAGVAIALAWDALRGPRTAPTIRAELQGRLRP